ncbi:DUF881 domain-containing protein [Propioniciclava flava]
MLPKGRRNELQAAAEIAASTPVAGPSVTVTLTDAQATVQPAGVDEDLLVVHQQDIQAVINALWASGAEAVTVQGQRIGARTGIKCVGNTVVVHGVPYAPPYVISAIGDHARLEQGLRDSDYLRVYRQYVDAYRLGYDVTRQARTEMPAYTGRPPSPRPPRCVKPLGSPSGAPSRGPARGRRRPRTRPASSPASDSRPR